MQGFHVATFNLENLNRPGVFYFERDDPAYDEASFETKCNWVGSILDEGRVDLAGLQEVFSFEAVEAAVRKSKHMTSAGTLTVLAPGTENRANEVQKPNGRIEANGPFVGLATTLPVLAHESIAVFPPNVVLRIPFGVHDSATDIITLPINRFERAVLKARVTLPGDVPATVLVVHLKSKRPKFLPGEDKKDPFVQALGATRSLLVRAAEAVALRAVIAGIIDDPQEGHKGEPLILLGDLNDDLSAVTTQVIAGDEPPPFFKREQKQRLWDVLMYSVHDIQEAQSYRDVSYTHIFNGRYELLDHIFVSQEFVRQFPERIAEVRNTRIFNDHIFDERLAAPGLQPAAPRTAPLRSDHGIPVTEISMRAASEPPQP